MAIVKDGRHKGRYRRSGLEVTGDIATWQNRKKRKSKKKVGRRAFMVYIEI